MKFIAIVLLLIISVSSFKVISKEKDGPVAPIGGDPLSRGPAFNSPVQLTRSLMTQVFETLFTDPTRRDVKCFVKKTKEQLQLKANITEDGAVWSAPRQKINYFEKRKMGRDSSAYLFDYLDDVLQKDIVNEFSRIFKEAQGIRAEATYKEPYALERLVGVNDFTGNQVPPRDEMIKKITALTPSFQINSWETFITCGQVNQIIKQWGWDFEMNTMDPGLYIVDKYDFNGDGRLDTREFIIAMINNNRKVIEGLKKCRNCMETIVLSKLDPIYMYLDCSGNGMITAEQMWAAFQKLKRSTLGYDIFKCQLDSGKYRTSAVNDFVLKAHKLVNGKVTKEEFRAGILIGYWNRQTDKTKVVLDDGHNSKTLRWGGQNGNVDIICERINNNMSAAK